MTNVVRNYVGGQTTPFGEVVYYTCEPGTFFGEDYHKKNFTLTCYNNGSYEFPGTWRKCYHPTGLRQIKLF